MTNQSYEGSALAAAYDSGNRMPERTLRAWVALICGYAPCESPHVLDLGSGTGMFSEAVARFAAVEGVLGVEGPSPAAPPVVEPA